MTDFRSNDELFEAVTQLQTRLDRGGQSGAAAALGGGFACLNGLTDGWALFLESIEKVRALHEKQLAEEDRQALAAIHAAVKRAVHRRR